MQRIGVWILAALCMCLAANAARAESPAPEYRVAATIKLGGEGGWDYLTVDSEARRLYISRATRVMVVDLDKQTLAGEIKNTPGVHGIALVPKQNRGFISNGVDSTV